MVSEVAELAIAVCCRSTFLLSPESFPRVCHLLVMPRVSERRRLLDDLEQLILLEALMESTDDSSGCDYSSDDSDDDDWGDFDDEGEELLELYTVIKHSRYIDRPIDKPRRTVKSRDSVENFFVDLSPGLFRQLTRMDKGSFSSLLGIISDHPVFRNKSPNPQAPVFIQLAVALDSFGHGGNAGCLSRTSLRWGLGHGSLVNYTKRVMTALENKLSKSVMWPNREERHQISNEFAAKGFPGCVGLINRTLLSLSQRPRFDGETYFDRYRNYSVNAQIVCDLKKRIRFLAAVMPGSSHDLVCLERSPLWRHIDAGTDNSMFDRDQYLLSDSGYTTQRHLVPSYRMAAGDRDKEDFNTCVANARVASEHCIGILKSRWSSLKRLRTQLKTRSESDHLSRWISCCVILHNFLLSHGDEWSEADGAMVLEPDLEPPECEASTSRVGSAVRDRVQQICLAQMRNPGGVVNCS